MDPLIKLQEMESDHLPIVIESHRWSMSDLGKSYTYKLIHVSISVHVCHITARMCVTRNVCETILILQDRHLTKPKIRSVWTQLMS